MLSSRGAPTGTPIGELTPPVDRRFTGVWPAGVDSALGLAGCRLAAGAGLLELRAATGCRSGPHKGRQNSPVLTLRPRDDPLPSPLSTRAAHKVSASDFMQFRRPAQGRIAEKGQRVHAQNRPKHGDDPLIGAHVKQGPCPTGQSSSGLCNFD